MAGSQGLAAGRSEQVTWTYSAGGGRPGGVDVTDQEAHERWQPNRSALREIRSWLTEALTQLHEGTDSYAAVARMRNACNTYLTHAHDPITTPFTHLRPHFREALLELRQAFREDLQDIHTELRLDAAAEVAGEIPSTVREFPQVAPGPREVSISSRPNGSEATSEDSAAPSAF